MKCLVLEWNEGFAASITAERLSQSIRGVEGRGILRSLSTRHSQVTSDAVSDRDLYSASVELLEIVDYFLDDHETILDPR